MRNRHDRCDVKFLAGYSYDPGGGRLSITDGYHICTVSVGGSIVYDRHGTVPQSVCVAGRRGYRAQCRSGVAYGTRVDDGPTLGQLFSPTQWLYRHRVSGPSRDDDEDGDVGGPTTTDERQGDSSLAGSTKTGAVEL